MSICCQAQLIQTRVNNLEYRADQNRLQCGLTHLAGPCLYVTGHVTWTGPWPGMVSVTRIDVETVFSGIARELQNTEPV